MGLSPSDRPIRRTDGAKKKPLFSARHTIFAGGLDQVCAAPSPRVTAVSNSPQWRLGPVSLACQSKKAKITHTDQCTCGAFRAQGARPRASRRRRVQSAELRLESEAQDRNSRQDPTTARERPPADPAMEEVGPKKTSRPGAALELPIRSTLSAPTLPPAPPQPSPSKTKKAPNRDSRSRRSPSSFACAMDRDQVLPAVRKTAPHWRLLEAAPY